jgi:16S rRNA C1402 (ribose-2'-O) methylase RsmI
LGTKQILIARELTKKFETIGVQPNNVPVDTRQEGEFTVVVSEHGDQPDDSQARAEKAADLFGRLTNNTPLDDDEAVHIAALMNGVSPKEVAKLVKKRKILADQQRRTST